MLIIPTEKRLDWNRAPIVLMAIVILNIAVYFLYQSTDNFKIAEAFDEYTNSDQQFYVKERELYIDYYELDANEFNDDQAFDILIDEEFYSHLKESLNSELDRWDYLEYFEQRDPIQDLIRSISSMAYGYIPNNYEFIRLFTHMFMHGDVMHLLGNLFFLVLCGFAVEAAIGHVRFLIFYLVSGIGAVLAFALADLSSNIPLVGASGAISGVMAMYLGVFKLKKIEFFYWFYFFVGYFRAPALMILPFYIGKEVYQFLTMEGSNVAFMAHAGGFVTGAILLAFLTVFFPKTISEEYIKEDDIESERLEKLADIYKRIETYRFKEALRLLKEYQTQYDEDEKLKYLAYHLLSIQQSDDAKVQKLKLATRLLSVGKIEKTNLSIVARMWFENPDLKESIDNDRLRRIAWSLCDLNDLKAAEAITLHLSTHIKDDSIISLLQKLAKQYAEQSNQAKRIKYLKLAQSISASGV
ncbi:MAG: rhomboid family intramembrane serine protease [Saccharospirillaceae bacterium]|nr:rhomboid family intramembrane serine protease [Pseudomonadales bacterium]NRB80186.1 rhomboid family intramembrane serine protease [Saccharospirillaceae bacterium]